MYSIITHSYVISNIDVTIIAQKPKVAPYIEQMENNVAHALGLEKNQINIKATTEEGLGFTGSLQGISAHAVCLLEDRQVRTNRKEGETR